MKNKYSFVRIRASRRLFIPSILATALAFALSMKPSNAADAYWDSNGTVAGAGVTPTGTWGVADTLWNATSAGDTTAPVAWLSGDTAVFSAGTDATLPYTVTLSGTQTIGGLTVEEGTPTISGAGILDLNSAATPFNITGTANISSVISGATFGIAKSGTGLLTLSGLNTYTGKTSVTAGILAIAADTGLGTAPGAAVADQLTLDGGTLRVSAAGQTLSANRGITIGASGATIDTSTIPGSAITTTIGGVVAGTGPLTLKATGNLSSNGGGDGGLGIRLNQATNTFIGDVTITSGLVSYAHNLSFGDAANKIILNGGGLLDNNANINLARDIEIQAGGGTFRAYGSVTTATWSGALTGSGAVNRTDGGTLTLSGNLSGFSGTFNNQGGNTTLTGTAATIGGNWTTGGGNLTVNSAVNQALAGNLTGAGAFVKDSAGILTLSGANNHTGATTITAGTLRQGVANAVSLGGALTVNGTGVFDLNAFNASVATLGGAATAFVRDDAAGAGTTTLSITNAGTSAVTINNGATRTVALRVTNPTGSFTLTNGSNTYSGGTVLTNSASGTRMTLATITAGAYGTGAITIGESATDLAGIYFTTATQTFANPIIFNTALGNDRVGIRTDVAGITLSGVITANLAPATFTANTATAGAFSLTNQVTGASGIVLDITSKSASATQFLVTLNNATLNPNNYQGDTVINFNAASGKSATLALGVANQIPDGSGRGNVIINTNGTGVGRLNLAGFSDTINGLSGNGTVDGVSGTPTLTIGGNNATATFSGSIVNAAGSLALAKTGTGTQTLSGASTFSGGTTVSNGTLIATGSSSLGTNSGVTVANGATLAYQPTAAGPLSLGTGVLNFASGSRVRAALGGTLGQSSINSSGAAVTVAGPVTLDIFVIPGAAPAAGTHNLITAGSGLNNATYSIGSVFNAGNYTLSGLTQSATAVSITTATATPLTAHFWKGGFSDGNNVWAISNGTSASNWASDAGGTDTSLTPGPTSTVTFSATGATNQGDMILGANMSIAGMVVNDTNAIVLNTNVNGFALTLGAGGMQINSGAGAVTIAPSVVLGAAQSWINDGSGTLTQSGNVANGGFAYTLGGASAISLSGIVSGTGALTKTGAGALTISSAQTYTGLTSLLGGNTSLTNSNALATTTVEPNGGTLDFGALTAASLGGLQGSQNLSLLNLSSAPITLTVGANNSTTTYAGVLSGAAANLVKSGTGNLTLTGTNTYSGTTTVSRGVVFLGAAAPTIQGGLIMNGPDQTYVRTLQANQFGSGVVVSFPTASGSWNRLEFFGRSQTLAGITTGTLTTQGGGVIQNSETNGAAGNVATLTLDGAGDYIYNGHLRDTSSNGVGTHPLSLSKTGSGTQTLIGNVIVHSGTTLVSNGTLKLTKTTAFNSPIINSATVELFEDTTGGRTGASLSGAGTYNKTGAGIFRVNGGQTITATGQFNIQQGALQNDANAVNWIGNKADIDVSSGAILDLYADAIFLDVLTGSGIVQSNYGNATGQSGTVANHEKLVLGTNDGVGSFAGVIRNNSLTNVPGATTSGGGLELVKVGTGTQSLTGTNLYTGSTTVTGGTLSLDFAVGGTSNIIAPTSAVVLAGGTLEIKGGSGETNTQTFGGISGTGKIQLTQNSATSINVTLGAVNVAGGLINFAGSDATVGALGNLNFLTSTTTLGDNGTTRLGPHLWNGTGWASTSATGGNHVVEWVGTYTDLTTDGNNVTNPSGELRIIDGTAAGTAATYGANTTAESLLMAAPTYATTLDLGTNTLTLGNGAGAVGSLAANVGAQAITVGATAGQGFLTAGTSAAASTLAVNNQSSSLVTINSVISNNAATGVVSLATSGATTIRGVNTFTGSTSVTSGTLTIGAAGTLGAGTYAGAVSNSGSFVYASSAAQTLSGVVSGTGTLVVNGSGTLTLSGVNTYTGATNVVAGSLKLGNAAGLGSTPLVTVASGGTLDLAGFASGRPLEMSGTGVSSVGALYNSSTTLGASIGTVKLLANASMSSAVPGADNSKMLSTGNFDLNGNKLTITSGMVQPGGMQAITNGDIDINSGATMYYLNGGSLTNVTGTITVNAGGQLDTRDSNNSVATTAHTIALNGGVLGNGLSTNNNGGGIGAVLRNNITVDATNGGTISAVSSGFNQPMRLLGSISGSGPLTVTNNNVEFRGDGSGYTGTLTATGGTVQFNTAVNQVFSGKIAGGRPLTKSSAATTTTLTGNLSYTGLTTVASGTLVLSGDNFAATGATTIAAGAALKLDYSTSDTFKIPAGVLTLSGGAIELAGGTFADGAASTTLTAATASNITRSSGTATLSLGTININTTGRLNLAQSGIARTTNANNALGVLGSWATIGGSIPAMNDGTGLIVAATTVDLTRLSSGSKVIVDGASSHVRFIEGTGTAGSFTLGAATTNISTLTQSAEGGVSAATVELASQRLVLNTVTAGTGAGALTIASAPNLGFLKAAGTSLEFRDLASVGGITVNAIIEDGTAATTVTKTDAGVLTFSGTNSYTGGTVVNAGTLTASLGTTAGTRFPFGSAAITANSGTTLRMFAGSTGNAMTFGNAINLNTATLTSEDAVQTYTGNIALTGANTVNVTYSDKSSTFSGIVSGGGSLTKALPGVLTLSNINTYTGGTTITGGTIRTTNTAALGAAGQALTLNGGTLQLASDTALSTKNVTVSASSTIILDRATTGGGLSTSFGNLTFGSNFTLSVNKGANVASGISTLNFTGFPALGAASTTTTFSVGQDVEVNLSGSLTGTQAFARVTKTGAGTLILSGNNNFWDPATNTGLVTISGGTVDLRSTTAMGDGLIGVNRIDLSMAAATTLRLGTDTALGNNANLTLTGSGATIISDRASAGAGITNQFNVLSMAAHTLNVTGGSNVTSGTTQVNFNSATLTGNAVLNVVNPTAGSTNMLVSGIMSGAFSLTKSGSGTLTLQGANTYSTTTAISGGTLNLSGAAGAIASSTGITLSNGGILTLANTSTANNGNRIAGTFAMNGGRLNFTNNQGAVNYAEATGALSVGGGTNTIATSQAATSQTSILTFASLARTAGTLNFTGTGLGTTVDTKNEIRFTTNPTLTAGIIGTWATVNGTDFATTTGANNSVVAYSAYTDVTRLGVSASTIADGATTNVRIVEGSGSAFNILLGAATTTINTLNQSTFGGTSAAIIDPDATFNTLAVNSILVSSGAGGLTIGTTVADGTVKSAGTALQVIENSTGGSTINSLIANGTAASTFTKSGTGLLTLTGTNTYTGVTTIDGGILAVSVMANGGANSGIGAAAVATGNLVLSNGTLRYTGNTVASTRGFTITAETSGTVDVSTSAQTLTLSGGIAATTGNLVKSGAGILTLSAASAHSGTTAVTGSGRLTVSSTMLNSSAFSAGTGATLEFGATNIFVGGHGTALADSRVITADGGTLLFNASADFRFGNVTLTNGATWTSNRVVTGAITWDALLGNTVSGPATVNVTGTIASTMNGAAGGGIRLAGVQNFNVADVTSSTATDLTVNMVLGGTGNFGGTGGINKIGAGTMTLAAVNLYAGNTFVNAGVLSFSGAGVIYNAGSNTATVSVAPGAQIVASGTTNNVLGFASGATWNISGTFNSSGGGAQTMPGNVNLNNGTLSGIANGTFGAFLTNAAYTTTLTANGATNTISSANFGMSNGSTLAVSTPLATDALSITSPLGVAAQTGALTKSGLGTLSLTPAGGSSTFTGGLTVSGGLVQLTGTNLGGSVVGAGTLRINTGGTVRALSHNSLGQGTGTLSPLFVNGGTFEGAEYNHINTITMTGGSIVPRSGTTPVDGLDMKVFSAVNPSITTNASATTATISLKISNSSAGPLTATVADGAAATDLSISAVIAGTQSVIKAGPGTMTLTGANSYAGGTTLNQGTLTVGTGGTLGATTGSLAVSNTNTGAGTDAILNLATAVNTTTGSLSGTIATPSGGVNTATINTQTGRTFTVNQTVAGTYAGVIAGTGDFTLGASSTNTLTLTGANTYTGATSVAAGTLALVGGSQASPITVSTGASLSFTLGSPTTSTSTFDVTAGTIKIAGAAPTLPRYTLITSSTGITGTPTLDAAIPGYVLQKYGNSLVLETVAMNLYQTWADTTYVPPLTAKLPGDDQDGDTYNNLMEYAFGTQPTVSSGGSLTYTAGGSMNPGQPWIEKDGGVWYAVFARRVNHAAAGLTYTVEFTNNLVGTSWEATLTAPTVVATDGTIDAVRVPFPNFIDINGPNGPQKPNFFRVVITSSF